MTRDAPEVYGRPVEEVAAALADPDGPDEAAVADALAPVVEDGVVSRDRLDEALAGLAKVVSTPETRIELARDEVERAREAADGRRDVDVVASRVDALDDRLDALEPEVDRLGDRLSTLLDRADDPAAAYEVARELRALTEDANALQGRADELRDDAESTTRWLESADVRRREFEEDIDAVAEAVDGLAASVAWLAGETDDPPDGVDPDDPGACWADAVTGARVNALLLADLRAELGDLRTLAGRDGHDPDLLEAETRLDDLAARRDRLADRLDDLADPAWREAHGDRLARVDDVLSSFDPPVAWGAVRAALDDV